MDDATVLFALLGFGLILAVPLSVAILFWRQRKLRLRLEQLLENHTRQNDALHRELLEVKRQLAATLSPSHEPAQEKHEPTRVPVSPSVATPPPVSAETRAPIPQHPLARPVEKPVPEVHVQKTPTLPQEPVVIQKPAARPEIPADSAGEPKFCPWCGTVHAGGADKCPPVSRPAEHPKPATPPIAANVPANREQVNSAVESQVPASTWKPDVIPAPPPLQKPAQPSITPLPAARVSAPSQTAGIRKPAAKTADKRIKSIFALEETLGRNWLNKLGITLLVLGIASFGIYELGQLGPAGKVFVSYAVAIALLAGGVFFERNDRYRILGHTLIGGGWALLFFTTYALHHVDAMRVVSSETLDLILMLAVAAGMAVHTLRYRSQLVTGLSFLLGYSTVALSHDTVYSLSAGVVLAIGLVSIVLKMGWYELEVFGILSSYLNHLYWLYRILGPDGAQGHAFPDYTASTALLLFYWAIFRLSYVVRKITSPTDEKISTVAALVNTLFLLGTMKFQSVHPELAFYALLVIGAIEFTAGQLPITRRRRQAFVVLTIIGSALMIAAVPFRYSGNNVAILWLIGGEVLLLAGAMFEEVVFRRLGLLAGVLVGAHLAIVDFRAVMAVRQSSEATALAAGMMFALCAVVFYVNVLFVPQRWPLFATRVDVLLIAIHSYIGAFAAASAAWALCSGDATAVAFAGIMLALTGIASKLKSTALKPSHLQTQYAAIGCLALYRVAMFNFHHETPDFTHVTPRLITLPIVAGAFYLTAKWAVLRDDTNQRLLRHVFAFAGTALLASLIYYEVPELWQPFALILFAVALLEASQKLPYYAFIWHTHILSFLAIGVAVTIDVARAHQWHSVPLHAVAALPVVAGLYWIAKRTMLPHTQSVGVGRALYTWAATGVMAWILFEAMPAPWIAIAWIFFAIAIAIVMRWTDYRHLAWQANALAAAAAVRTATFNYTLQQKVWPGFSLRLVTVALVAAGIYFLSRRAVARGTASARAITYLHTFCATTLLGVLAWYEAPSGWLAAVWAVFAFVLAIVDRRFELEELGWQAHLLALLTLVRGVVVNLHLTDTWHGVSVRLLSLAIVAVVFYALSRLIRMPELWREQEFHHAYSWAASTMVASLMWYELQPLTVAVGWAVFGLVLFEYGLMRKVKQFRFQSYVALSASFARIFFSNLTAGVPGELWGPRTYTVLPIALILFFVYSQIGADEKDAAADHRLRLDMLLAYLGTGSIVALLYFQFQNDWMVTAWALLVLVLFAAALWLKRTVFLHQALLLTVATVARGMMHNLFGASYFSRGTWTGRFFVLGSAAAVLLACLPLAFRIRAKNQSEAARQRWWLAVAARPEQLMFFAPVLLLTMMLALKMRAGMVTASWGVESLAIILLALAVNERSFRLTGLVLLLLCVGKVIALDAWGLEPRDRYITFIVLGAALLLVSFLYSKYRDTIRQFL